MASTTLSPTSQPLVSRKLRRHHHGRRLRVFQAACRSAVVESPSVALARAKPASAAASLASMWEEIQGCNDWNNLVAPLNPILGDEIVRYGEFVAACYKVFDLDPRSKRYLNCKYGKSSMLKEVGMEARGYEVTKYIYATADIDIPTQAGASRSRWIGYVAVSNDDKVRRLGRRDILVSFRGTVTNTEWIANLMSSLTPARLDPHEPRPDVKVESGFLSLYTSDDSTCKFSQGSCREQLLNEVSRLVNKYKDEEMSITLAGHSMGSSLALLFGYDAAELGINRIGRQGEIPITLYSFGGPRVGNLAFKERCEELRVKVLRVVNVHDPITKLPGVVFNESFSVIGGRYEMPWSSSCYAHVGVEVALDYFDMQNLACVHDIETYIALVKRNKMVQVRRDGEGLVPKAKKWVRERKFDAWAWHDAARQVGYLVQSLGFEV
ncbi:phospholipase A1-Ialpha2, chloroplastic-like [Typha latifolia]|uniref:phospholipase A1-Ialpha2, chloroplastic-like n=1 Tax=Typha latifolia TaxID=4733 RepID=UPI003C2D44B3